MLSFSANFFLNGWPGWVQNVAIGWLAATDNPQIQFQSFDSSSVPNSFTGVNKIKCSKINWASLPFCASDLSYRYIYEQWESKGSSLVGSREKENKGVQIIPELPNKISLKMKLSKTLIHILVVSKFWLEASMCSFLLDISLQLLWVTMTECDGWIIP